MDEILSEPLIMRSTFLCGMFLYIPLKIGLTFESVDENVKSDHSNKSYRAVLSCGTVYYPVQGGSEFLSLDEILKCDQ